MEGLEISEVKLSELEFSSRIDAEYYRPSMLDFENLINSKGGSPLKNLSSFLIGPFGSSFTVDNYVDIPDYRYIRGKDVKPFMLKDDDNVYMPKEDYERLSRYALKENDILVSVVGTLGNAALITKKDLPAIFSCKSTVLRANEINSGYLIAYLNCKYGRQLLLRKERGAIQKGFNLGDLESLEIFTPSLKFQNQIDRLFKTSLKKTEQSKIVYQQAENLLLETLGLKGFSPSKEPVNIKSFNESFGSTGRLDAEYFQLKYEDYFELINSYSNGVEPLGQVCTIKDNNFTPLKKSEYKYIELANIGKSGEITGATYDFGSELPTRARRKVNSNDVIISSIEGSLESCALVNQEFDNSLCSTGFYVLTSSKINSETLLVLFKSEPMQQLLKKGCSGTILTAIGKPELLKIPIPIIDTDTQNTVRKAVNESSKMRLQSEQLLELAKTAVEKAIEETEEEATSYINEKLTELKITIDNA